jgi:hypothetical protein
VLGSERLTGALLDRLTHHVHIPEMNGDSYRLKQSKHKRSRSPSRFILSPARGKTPREGRLPLPPRKSHLSQRLWSTFPPPQCSSCTSSLTNGGFEFAEGL